MTHLDVACALAARWLLTENRRGSVVRRCRLSTTWCWVTLADFKTARTPTGCDPLGTLNKLIQRFYIRATDRRRGDLFGGTVQKVPLAGALARRLKVLVAAQPTRGLDIGATATRMSSSWSRGNARAGARPSRGPR